MFSNMARKKFDALEFMQSKVKPRGRNRNWDEALHDMDGQKGRGIVNHLVGSLRRTHKV